MEIKLDQIKGIGPKMYQNFRQLNIWSTYDLILRRPKTYDHFIIKDLDDVKHKEVVTVLATIVSLPKEVKTKKVHLVSCQILISNTKIKLVIFNRPYIIHQLKENQSVLLKGTYDLYQKTLIAQKIFTSKDEDFIKPIYQYKGIYDAKITEIVTHIFANQKVDIYETLPQNLLKKYHLISRYDAYYKLHLPTSDDDIHQARRRMKYEEAFYLQLKLQHEALKKPQRPQKAYDINRIKALIDQIPYALTDDQKQAVNDIFKDFKKDETTYRLILGDVGSGKTIVAAIAMYGVVTAGQQVAFMAPTELLALQQYHFFKSFLKDLKVCLLSKQTKDKETLKKAISLNQYDVIIGTHALIQPDVSFANLGLIIIDEQHKFGVDARNLLIEKAMEQDVIYLSATPIPRTLAMLYFNQADISIIRQKPAKRQKIETSYISDDQETKVYHAINQTLKKMEHVYVVVPAITSTQVDDNIQITYEKLKQSFPNTNIFVMHGKLKEDEKTSVMTTFKNTKGSILLSTTMIEVGIDIPTATLMVIYSAERFGLAQLHQLRGRVGRSMLKSSCLLVSNKSDLERLHMLETIEDGFTLSDYDLKERGPGDFLGVEQSGYLNFNYLSLIHDQNILKTAYEDVKRLINEPDFKTNPKYKYLHKAIKDMLKI